MQTQRALASPSLTPSADGRPDRLTYQWEPFSAVVQEVLPLLREHWHEIGLDHDKCPLDPNWQACMAYEQSGQLHVFTARSEGALVGYNAFIVHGRLHYQSTKFALNDVIWLHPLHREGFAGVRLIKGAEPHLRSLGAKFIEYGPKLHFRDGHFQKLLTRLGYGAFETRHRKYIGE